MSFVCLSLSVKLVQVSRLYSGSCELRRYFSYPAALHIILNVFIVLYIMRLRVIYGQCRTESAA